MHSPADVLAKAARKYDTCNSYQDQGFVELSPDFGYSKKTFRTWFTAPTKFRFEWISYHPKFGTSGPQKINAICSDGKSILTAFESDDRQVLTVDSLTTAVAMASGISSESVALIPSLLIAQVGSMFTKTLLALDDVHFCENSKDRQFCVMGTRDLKDDTEIWLDSNYVIHRVKIRHDSLGGSPKTWFTEATYTNQVFDSEISDACFVLSDNN